MSAGLLTGTLLDSRLLGQSFHAAATEPGEFALGPVGRCPHEPTCTWFVVDSSGSVSGVHGNDPIARRFDEAQLAIHAVASRCRCQQELVAVVHFDTPTSLDLPPIGLARPGWRRIERSLAIPPDAAGQSLLRPSLDTVHDLAGELPDHQHVLVILTDFQLLDHDLPGLYRELAGVPGVVHAVSLRAAPPTQLLDDERVVVTHITPDAERGSVAKAILAALTTHRAA